MMASNCANAQESIDTDYYHASINTDGSLDIVDISTGTVILNDSPQFYFDYGTTNVTPTTVTVPNGSFEIDDDNDNIPDGWSINQSYIRLSTEQASRGSKSLKFNATATDVNDRMAYSPLFTITQGAQYTISIDSYLSSITHRTANVYAYCYETTDGTGTGWKVLCLPAIPSTLGSWVTTSADWRPPSNAQSFRLLIFMSSSSVATIYFDNISITEKDFLYGPNNSSIAHTTIINGNATTITATDDTNPYVTVNYQYQFNTHSPYINYLVTTQYKQDVLVTEERCDFIVPSQNAQVMTKDLQLTPFVTTNTYWSNNYTPKVVRFDNGLSFLGADTMESMQLQTSGYDSKVSFDSDYALNHPHYYFIDNNTIVNTNETQRTAGDTYSASVTFAIDTNEPLQYLVKTRQPYGYDAVLTLSNHPDEETLDRIKAVAYGTTDESDPNYGKEGIAGRGIGWTKAVFVSGASPYASLADANFKTFTDLLYQDGVETIGHTITPDTDSRPVVASGLAILSQYNARNWIDHGATGGTNNWEDLASKGAIEGSDNYILDLLAQYNYQYAWSYQDLETDNNALNMLKPASTLEIRPFLFYNNRIDDNIHDNKKIYLWSTINTQKHPEAYYTPDRVDNLIHERGVHIGHEYVGYSSCENHTWYNDNGTIKICPTFDSELEYIAGQRTAGLLWLPTMATLGDYLVPLKDVLITYNSDGSITVTNNSSVAVTGVTLLAENNIESVKIGDFDLVSFGGSYGNEELVLPTIDAGSSVILKISYGAKNPFTPTITSNDTGKNKVNEITGYWDDANEILTMTAEGRNGNYSFTVTIPSRAKRILTVQDITNNTFIGTYTASDAGAITFVSPLNHLSTFKIATAYSNIIDDFDLYGNTGNLQNIWHSILAEIQLNTDSNFARNVNSMEYEYVGDANVESYVPSLPSTIGTNWTTGGFTSLALSFYGQSFNFILPMYITLTDGNGNKSTVVYGDNGEDPNDLQVESWHEWIIGFDKFRTADVDMTDIENIRLGFGSGDGSGRLYIDSIQLYQPRCVLSKRSPDFAKVDFAPAGSPCGDCSVGYQELTIMADEWLESPPSDANADLNNDGTINMLDFAILANYWLKTNLTP
jgi:hypothetical protein